MRTQPEPQDDLRADHRRPLRRDVPYTSWLTEEKKRQRPGRGGDRPDRYRQLHDEAVPAGRLPRHRRQLLWIRAEEHKRDHDWDRLKTTVDLITKLQPHFLSIWTFQGWNLAYNVSVEWDAPEDKYELDQEGHQVPPGRRREEPALARPDLGHRLDLLPQARLRRRVDHPPPPLPRRRRRGRSRPTSTPRRASASSATTTSSSATAGSAARSTWSTRGPPGSTRATGDAIEYVDPTPQRKGRPDDIAFRSMPATPRPATPPASRR